MHRANENPPGAKPSSHQMRGLVIEVGGFGVTNRCFGAKLFGWVVVLICVLLCLIPATYQKLHCI